MSVITNISKNTRRNTTEREPSEFDGLWINVGVSMKDPDGDKDAEPTFVRLPRGIAVSDLKHRKVYDNMDPEFAAQVNLMNSMITAIEGKCASLAEGESIPINMELRLYRRQEETEVAATPTATADLTAALFG